MRRQLVRAADRGDSMHERLAARAAGRWEDGLRLADVQSEFTDHTWLWSLCSAHGPVLEPGDYADAVRIRLGADMVEAGVPCQRCGALIRGSAAHALACGGAGECVGHNRIRDAVHGVAHAADPSSCLEPAGLVASRPKRRPADVLTHAATSCGCVALDIGVTTPFSAGSGDDCVAAMRRRKLQQAEPWIEELRREGIEYRPLCVSAFGRWEHGAAQMLEALVRRASRRAGLASPAAVRRRLLARLGVEVARRSVAVVRACLPGGDGSGGELARLVGGCDEG